MRFCIQGDEGLHPGGGGPHLGVGGMHPVGGGLHPGEGVCIQGVCIRQRGVCPTSPTGTGKAGSTHPTGMLSCVGTICNSHGCAMNMNYTNTL